MRRRDRRRRFPDGPALERLATALLTQAGDSADPQARQDFRKALSEHARSVGMNPQTLWKNVEATLRSKEQARRIAPFLELATELVNGPSIAGGDTPESERERFAQLCKHTESLWADAVLLYRNRRFPRAAGAAVSCIEELGKVGIARMQVYLHEVRRRAAQVEGGPAQATPPARRRNSPLYSHPQKHVLAAGAGALVNSRLDRILGLKRVVEFLEEVERRAVEPFRQSCYYADNDGTQLLLPTRVTRGQALFYVVLAGELMVEIASLTAGDFTRQLRQVQRFERSAGHRWR